MQCRQPLPLVLSYLAAGQSRRLEIGYDVVDGHQIESVQLRP